LLACAIACAVASPVLHYTWFMAYEGSAEPLGFFVMCIGDLAGSVIVLYAAKAVLALRDRRARV
jgi:hypothetical protein